jgi:CubicO group peptidase (beta-lactamase class C family)
VVAFGFILGEVVRRVSGRSIKRFVAEEFFEPLGMDAYLALPATELDRTVALRRQAVNLLMPAYVNRPAVRRAVVPAASLHTTARSLAAFCRMLLDGGVTPWGRRLLARSSIEAALAVSRDGEVDRVTHRPARYGHGFQLGACQAKSVRWAPGRRSAPSATTAPAFARSGLNPKTAWSSSTCLTRPS